MIRALPATGNAIDGTPAKKPRLDERGDVDLMAILGPEVVKIGTVNPVEDFVTLLKKKPVDEVYREVTSSFLLDSLYVVALFFQIGVQLEFQMEKVIGDLLRDSGGSNAILMDKSRQCLEAYRKHALDGGRAPEFNRWMERFKQEVVDNFFNDFWLKFVVPHHLSLISSAQSDASNVSQVDADQFLLLPKKEENVHQFPDDDDDLVIWASFF